MCPFTFIFLDVSDVFMFLVSLSKSLWSLFVQKKTYYITTLLLVTGSTLCTYLHLSKSDSTNTKND